MYAALWRVLPGSRWAKAVQFVVLVALVVVALFSWVFPATSGWVLTEDVTVPVPSSSTPEDGQ